jgi:3-mercaptopyruvate sulfurtransferase SseA
MREIRKNKGPVILVSGDTSVSARVWMVLSETGMKNLYILTGKSTEAP